MEVSSCELLIENQPKTARIYACFYLPNNSTNGPAYEQINAAAQCAGRFLGTRFIPCAVAHSYEPIDAGCVLNDRYFADVVVNDGARDLHLVGPRVLAKVLQVRNELAPLIRRTRRQSGHAGACWASARLLDLVKLGLRVHDISALLNAHPRAVKKAVESSG
jgi:hypothetical protein